jgi:hypothetical protein
MSVKDKGGGGGLVVTHPTATKINEMNKIFAFISGEFDEMRFVAIGRRTVN